MKNAKNKNLNNGKHDKNKYFSKAPINDNKISRKIIISIKYLKYKNKNLKNYNKMNKICDTHVENDSKG